MWEWPKITASASGNARRIRASRPLRRARVVDHADPRAGDLRPPPARAARCAAPRRRRCRARRPASARSPRSPRRPLRVEKSPAWMTRSALARSARRTPSAAGGSRAACGCRRSRRRVTALRARRGTRSGRRRAAPAPRSAAKWPPRSNSVQRRRSPSCALGPRARRRARSPPGSRRPPPAPRSARPAASRQRSRASARVEAHRGGDRPGRPVEREEVAEVVLREPALDLAAAVRPAPVLVDQPGGEPGGRVSRTPAPARRARRPGRAR